MQFDIVFGIDQTGAAKGGSSKNLGLDDIGHGKTAVRPLPCAVAFRETSSQDDRKEPTLNKKWRLRILNRHGQRLALPAYSKDSLQALAAEAILRNPSSQAIDLRRASIVVDCVFGLATGLPKPGADGLWILFKSAAADTPGRSGYGRGPAERFFAEILEATGSAKTLPVRMCEALARANSVFQTRPYQKNIQCGSYRIWRDLGKSSERWTRFAWFENFDRAQGPWTFEAFPSLVWRELFGLNTRDRKKLRAAFLERGFDKKILIDERSWSAIERWPDWADAAVLVCRAVLLSEEIDRTGEISCAGQRLAPERLQHEGWILGLGAP